jgi:hypothetical protein
MGGRRAERVGEGGLDGRRLQGKEGLERKH